MKRTLIIGLSLILALALVVVLIYRRKMTNVTMWSWPAQGRISSRFGERVHPVTGATSFHNGIDIAVPIGTPIKAPADGKVVSIYTHDRGGKSLILEHANGWKTGYAHLNGYNVQVGDQVKQGDVIAYSGNTGIGTGAHLHFTMTNGVGQKVDPETLLA
jgi:murein DD-endopeptidase MepM/ murein hydrolase activator NlpD